MIIKNIFTRCFYLILFASTTVLSQTTTLPPAAQDAYNKGITAAKLPDYTLAIRYFEEARKLAPAAPEVFYNLGLAESKVPGRELRAIAWFGAYLAANPTAPNAAAVKEQMDVLVVRSQSNTLRLIKTVQDAASQLSGENKAANLREVAAMWAETGDIEEALKITDAIQDKYPIPWKKFAWADIAEAQAKVGDISGALKTVEHIQEAHIKLTTWARVAKAQAEAGDIVGAQKTADLIQTASYKSEAQAAIAEAIAKTQPTSQPLIPVSDWLKKLDSSDKADNCPLNTEPFLDLAGYLKSLPPLDTPFEVFASLRKPAKTIVGAQNVITGMLKQQVKQ